jgi:hypothetical protein
MPTVLDEFSETGLIGYPSFGANGWLTVKMLYNPNVYFMGNVQIESSLKQANKTWTVLSARSGPGFACSSWRMDGNRDVLSEGFAGTIYAAASFLVCLAASRIAIVGTGITPCPHSICPVLTQPWPWISFSGSVARVFGAPQR